MAVFRVEKTKDFTVMSNYHLRDVELSLKAKGLLSLMLSLPEDWDYTTKGLACICKDGVDSITSALKELENHGYLTRQRTRYENGRLGDITYTIHEKPVGQETKEKKELPKPEKPERENPRQANPEQAELKQEKPAQLNTELSNTDGLNINQSIYPEESGAAQCQDGIDKIDRMELADAYREIIRENIEYSILAERHGKQRMDETVELMLEVVLAKRPYIRIAGDDFPSCKEPVPEDQFQPCGVCFWLYRQQHHEGGEHQGIPADCAVQRPGNHGQLLPCRGQPRFIWHMNGQKAQCRKLFFKKINKRR